MMVSQECSKYFEKIIKYLDLYGFPFCPMENSIENRFFKLKIQISSQYSKK